MLSTKIIITNPSSKTAKSFVVNETSHFSITNGDVVIFGTKNKPYTLPNKAIKLTRKGDDLEIVLSENPLEVATLDGYFKLTNPPKIAAVTADGVVSELALADGTAISDLQPGESVAAAFNGQTITVDAQDLTFFEDANHDAAILTAIVGIGAVLLGAWFYGIEDDNEVKDTQKPSKPVVDDFAIDDVGDVQGQFKSGEYTDDTQPTFNGSGEPGGIINVYVNGEKQIITNPIVVGEDGKWEFDFEDAGVTLGEGKNDIQFSITDPSGNEGDLSGAFEVNVDTSLPTKENPFISEITLSANEGLNPGNIESGAVTDDATPVLSGNAESNIEKVKIYVTDPFNQVVLLGEAQVINGKWSFEPPSQLSVGKNTYHAVPVTKGGNELAIVDAPAYEFEFFGIVPAQVAFLSIREANEDGSFSVINPNDPTKTGEILVRGSAAPNTVVSVMVNGIEIGTANANELGYWEFNINLDGQGSAARGVNSFANSIAEDGIYTITASMDNGIGGKWTTADWNIELNRDKPNSPEFEMVLDHQGAEKGELAQGAKTDDALPILQGKGIPNTTIEIYDNGKLIGNTQTNSQGEWSFVPSELLANGEHSFTTVQIDRVGDRSEPSDAFVINVEMPEGTLIIAGAEYQSGNQTIKLGEQAYTNNTKPTIFGFGKPGDLIEISYGDKKGTTTVGADGRWTFNVTESLKDGEYIFNAKVITTQSRDLANDELINSSDEVFSLKILAAIPDTPVITEIFDTVGSVQTDILTREGKIFNDPAPYVSGTGEPGYVINLYNFGKLVGSTTVKSDGTWSLVALNAYSGKNEYTVTTVDIVGDVSKPSEVYEIFYDPTLNTMPLVDENDSEALRLIDDVETLGKPNSTPDYQEFIQRDGFTNDSRPTFTGKAPAGVKNVNIYEDGKLVATVKVVEGVWEYTSSNDLADGVHTYEAAAVSDFGNEGPKTKPWSFTVDTDAPPALEDVKVEGRDPETGDIGTGTPTITGNGKPGDKVVVEIDRDGDGKIDDKLVFAPNPGPGELPGKFNPEDGSFEITIPDDKAIDESDRENPPIIIVRPEDNAGNPGPEIEFPIIVDMTPPPALEDVKVEGRDPETGEIGTGTPTIIGKGEPGDKVVVEIDRDGDGIIDDKLVFSPNPLPGTGELPGKFNPEDGSFEVTIPEDKAIDTDGPVNIIVRPEDKAGNPGPEIEIPIIVDTVAPPALEDVKVEGRDPETGDIGTGTPTITGTGKPGDKVVVEIDRDGDGKIDDKLVFAPNPGPGELPGKFNPEDGSFEVTIPEDKAIDKDGPANIIVRPEDNAGNPGPVIEFPIIVDTVAPPALEGVEIEGRNPDTGEIGTGTPTITGKGEPGDKVVVEIDRDGDGSIDDTLVFAPNPLPGTGELPGIFKPDGSFEITIPEDKAIDTDGPANIIIRPEDKAGNTIPGVEYPIIVDTATPPPLENVVIEGANPETGEVSSSSPTIKGKGEPGLDVVIKLPDGKEIVFTAKPKEGEPSQGGEYEVEYNEDGEFTLVIPESDLGEGVTGELEIKQKDGAGNESPVTKLPITIDTTAPVAGQITAIIDDVTPVEGELNNGQFTNDNQLQFSGKAEANGLVKLYNKVNGSLIGEFKADKNGNWTFTSDVLADGNYEFYITVTDGAGNISAPSAQFDVTIDTSEPIVIDPENWKLIDDVGEFTGEVKEGDFIDDRQPSLEGRVPSNIVEVAIFVDGKEVGRASVSNNQWNYEFTEDLSLGAHKIEVSAINQAGSYGPKSAINFTIDLGTPPKLNESFLDLYDDVGDVQGTIAKGSATDDRLPEFKGIAINNTAFVKIYFDGKAVAVVPVNEDGTWTYTPEANLPGGDHSYQVAPLSQSGVEGEKTSPWTFKVLASAPSMPTIDSVVDNYLESESKIIQPDGLTNDKTLTINGRGEALVTIIINVNGKFAVEVTSGSDGRWSIDLPANVITDNGVYNITAKAKDAAGQTSEETGIYAINYDGFAPEQPEFIIKDSVGDIQGTIVNDSVIDDKSPVITGQAESGESKVEIFNNGKSVGFATVNQDGSWSYTLSLTEGQHKISVTETDKAGNTSLPSDELSFTVDSKNVELTIDYIEDDQSNANNGVEQIKTGGISNDKTPVLVGTATPGAVIEVWENGIKINASTIIADETGQWKFAVPTLLVNDGKHTYEVRSKSASGNEVKQMFNIEYDLTAPNLGTIESIEDTVVPNLGFVTNGGATNDSSPVLRGKAEIGSKVTITDKSNGQIIGTVTADSKGEWVYKALELDDGMHEFVITVTDKAGNVSGESSSFKVEVDTTIPATLPADAFELIDDVGEFKGPITQNGVTDDNQPDLVGRAPNGVVEVAIFVDGKEIGRAKVTNNEWNFVIDSPLTDGQHRISIAPVNRVGTLGEKTEINFTVETSTPTKLDDKSLDLVDDVGEVTGTIKPGDSTDDRQPEFKGVADSNTKFVKIYFDGKAVAVVDVKADGSWTYTPPSNLSGGMHTFEAAPLSQSGVEGAKSTAWEFNVIAQKPAQPTIDTLTDDFLETNGSSIVQPGGLTNDKTLIVGGRAEAGVTINVYVNGTKAGEVKVGMDGKWVLEIPSTLITQNGLYKVTATAVDAAGQISDPTGAYEFNYDGVAPNKPTLPQIKDSVGDKQGLIAQNDTIDDASPVITGKAESGESVIAIYDNGVKVGYANVGTDGSWSYTLSLATGNHAITVTEMDKAGNVSAPSDALNFTLDTSNVELTVNYLEDNKGNEPTQIKTGGLTNDDTPTLVGTATPGAIIEIWENGSKINSAQIKADSTGKWVFNIPSNLVTDGDHSYVIRTMSKSGNEVTVPFDVTYDLTAPNAGTIESVEDTVAPKLGIIANGEATNDSSPTLRGKAEAGALVTITDKLTNQVIGTITAGLDGNWTYKATELEDGLHRFVITVTDKAGNTSGESNEYQVEIDTTVPPTLSPDSFDAIDNVGDFTGKIKNNGVTDDARPELEGRAPNGVQEVVIYIDGKEAGRASVVNNSWTYKLSADLNDGLHTISVAPVNHVGTVGEKTNLSFTVETAIPTKLNEQFIDLYDDVGAKQGTIKRGEATDDRQPEFKGVAGGTTAFVKIYLDGKAVATVPVKEDGTWSYTPPTNLSGGSHTFEAAPLTKSGVEGAKSEGWNFTVLASAPSIPTIDTIIDNYLEKEGSTVVQPGGLTNDKTLTINGRGEGGVTILIFVNGKQVTETVAGADGRWSATLPSTSVSQDGKYEVTAKAKDAAGQESDSTGIYEFNYDGVAPNKPELPQIKDAIGDKQGDVAQNSIIDDASPVITGQAESGDSVVEIFDKGQSIGFATVNSDGSWSFTLSLAQGTHSISVVETDKAGNPSAMSDALNFTVDTSKVELTVDYLEDDFGNASGAVEQIKTGGISNDKTPVLVGTATPGAVIEIWENGVKISATNPVADATGKWRFTLPSNFVSDGQHRYEIRSTSKSGNEVKVNFDVEFDLTAPNIGTIDSIEDTVAPQLGFIENGAATNDSSPTLRGRAEAGATVTIIDKSNGQIIGTVKAGLDGKWTYKATELDDGMHNFVITVTDVAGNISAESPEFKLEIDTSIPASLSADAITILDDVGEFKGPIKNGDVTDDTLPSLTGRAPNGVVEVAIFVDGKEVGRATVINNAWTFDLSTELTSGEHTIAIAPVNRVGTLGEQTKTTFTVETSTPPALEESNITLYDDVGEVTGTIAKGGVTDDRQPEYKGTVTDSRIAFVKIYLDGKAVATVEVDSQGKWSYTPPANLSGGSHTFEVASLSKSGVEGPKSSDWTFTVLASAPKIPTIDTVVDNYLEANGSKVIQPEGLTNDKTLTVNGRADGGETILIFVNGTKVTEVTADVNGRWSVDLPESAIKGDGVYNITAKARDGAGQESAETGIYEINFDGTAPVQPSIPVVKDAVGDKKGNVADGETIDDASPVVSGRAESADSVVEIFDNGKSVGFATVNSDGTWSFTLSLAQGGHSITSKETDKAGNTSKESPALNFTVDTSKVELTVDYLEDNTGSVVDQVKTGGLSNDKTPALIGTATPGSIIEIWENGVKISATNPVADANGKWRFDIPTNFVSDGVHNYEIRTTSKSGNEVKATFSVEYDLTAPNLGVIESIEDTVAPNLGIIAKGDATNDSSPTLRGSAEASSVVTIIDKSNGQIVGSVKVGLDGKWTYKVTELDDGMHNFVITVTDAAGNVSGESAGYSIEIDTTVPATLSPDAVTLLDDVGEFKGPIKNGDITDDVRPSLEGRAPNGVVEVAIFVDGKEVGRATVSNNAWAYDLPADLTNGLHAVAVAPVNRVGTLGEKTTITFNVETATPPAINEGLIELYDDVGDVTGIIAKGGVTDDRLPEYRGLITDSKIAFVKIYQDGTAVATIKVDQEGKWSYTPPANLSGGKHTFSVAGVSIAGVEGPKSAEWEFTVLASAPSIPTIDTVVDNYLETNGSKVIQPEGLTNDKTLTINGRSEAGITILIFVNGVKATEVVAAPDGRWTIDLPENVITADGVYNITAKARDAAGQESEETGVYEIIYDGQAPAQPSMPVIKDSVGDKQGNVSNGEVIDDASPVVTGRAESGASTVAIFDKGNFVGFATVNPDGTWSYTLSLSQGEHSISSQETDKAGNKSAMSPALTFTVDSSKVELTVDYLEDNVGNANGVTDQIKSGGLSNDKTPVLVGTATPGSIVEVWEFGVKLSTSSLVADQNGQWRFVIPTNFVTDGQHNYEIRTTSKSGNEVKANFVVTFDLVAPNVGSIDSVEDTAAPVLGFVKNGEATNDSSPTLRGSAEAGGLVTIIDKSNGQVVGTVTAGNDGKWIYKATELDDGMHNFVITVTDKAGNVSNESAEFVIDVDTSVPETLNPDDFAILDDVGEFKGPIATGDITDDIRPSLEGRAPNGVVDIAIFVNNIEVGRAKVINNTWTYNLPNDLVNGANTIAIAPVNRVGTVGSQTKVTFTVDTAKPADLNEAAIDLIDDVGLEQGTIAKGSFTDDRLPEYKGFAGGNIKFVNIYLDGNKVDTVEVKGDGTWSYTPSVNLSGGRHTFEAASVSAAGVEGKKTPAWDFNVLASAPQQPTIDSVVDDYLESTNNIIQPGGLTNDKTLTINGRSEAGVSIVIYVNGVEAVQVTADGNGRFSATLPSNVINADGTYQITAKAKDAAGQLSPETGIYEVIYDGTAPQKPALPVINDAVGDKQGVVSQNQTIDDASPVITGKAESGDSRVEIFDNGTSVGFAKVNADGTWSFTLSLAQGPHSITVQETDKAGNPSQKSDALNFTVDTSKVELTVEHLEDNQGNANGATDQIKSGGLSNDKTPTLVGTATPGSVIEIWENGIKISAVNPVADGTGKWRFDIPSNLVTDGLHTYQIKTLSKSGNQVTVDFNIEYDLTAPVAGKINLVEDGVSPILGAIANGGATNDSSPTLKGIAEAGGLVTIIDKLNGQVVGTITAGLDGSWVYKATELDDGIHRFVITVTDKAGNTGPESEEYVVEVDTFVAPALDLSNVKLIDDVGTIMGELSNNDITDDNKPTLIGSNAPDYAKEIVIFVNKIEVGRATVEADGTWKYQFDKSIADGLNTISIAAVTKVGNVGNSDAAWNITVDTASPSGIRIAITGITEDTEFAGDFVTKDNTLSFSGSLTRTLRVDERVQISLDDGETWEYAIPTGNSWYFDNSSKVLADGDYTVQVRVVDLAGNVGSTASQLVVIDTTGPDASNSIDIASISPDTGVEGDFKTSENVITVSGTTGKSIGNDEIVKVSYDNGKTWHLATVDGLNWSVEIGPLANNNYTLIAQIFDRAGNEGPSDNQAIEINSSSVSNNVIEITGITTDSGEVGDFITNDNTLIFNGSLLNPLGNGESIEIRINNETWVKVPAADITANSWTYKGFEGRILNDGTYTLEVRIVNSVGSPGSTDSQQIVIDTVKPDSSNAIYIDSITPDTGISDDFITSATQFRLDGHTDRSLQQGETVQISFDNGNTWEYAKVINGVQWYYDNPNRTFAEGETTVKVRIVDAAWNVGAQAEQPVIVDITPPVISKTVDILGISPDTGVPGDYKTAADKIDITGKVSAPIGDDLVKVSIDGINWYTVTFIDGINWTVNLGPIANGNYNLVAKVFDKAGNGAAEDTQAIVIDKAYVEPNTITLDTITEDTGVQGDFKTKDNTLFFTGTLGKPLGANEQVWIRLNNGEWKVAAVNDTQWVFDNRGQTLADGVYNVEYQIVNVNGAFGAKDSKQVTIDTNGPSLTNKIYIDSISEDTGYDAQTKSDFITSDKQFVINGHVDQQLKADEFVQISFDGGSTWRYAVKQGSNWFFSLLANDMTLNDGTYSVQVRVVDDAENTGSTAEREVTIDTTAPTDVDVEIVSIDPDNGIVGDFQTNTGDIRVFGTLSKTVPGGMVKISINGGQDWIIATVDGTNWYADLTGLNSATYTIKAQVVDSANNPGRTDEQQLVINTGGVTENTVSITEITTDSGKVGDWLTNDTTLVIKGTLATSLSPNERVEISIDGKTWVQVKVTDTTWTYDNTNSPFSEGTHNIKVRIINNVSDVGSTDEKDIVIDTTVPDITNKVYFDRISDDNGIESNDLKTNDRTLEFFGHLDTQLASDEFVEISFDNGMNWTRVSVAGNGTEWYYDKRSEPFANGSYLVKVRVMDEAGNRGYESSAKEVVINDVPVLQNSITITTVTDDTGVSNTDFLTKDKNLILSGIIETNLSVGEYIRVSLDGGTNWLRATVNPDGRSWKLDLQGTTLEDGTYALKAQIVNQFGTPGAEHERELNIDSTITDSIISLDGITEDTNIVGDYNTADNTIIFYGSLSKALASDEFVEISLDNGVTWRKASVNDLSWSYDNTNEPLADNLAGYDIKVRVIDEAGNIASEDSQKLIVNKEPPVGNISVDPLQTLDTTPTVTGSFSGLRAGETVQVTIAGKVYSERNGNLTVNAATGKWSLQISDADALNYGGRNDMILDVQAKIVTLSGAVKEDSDKGELTIYRAATVTKSPDFDYLADDTPVFIGRGNVGAGDVITVVIKNNAGQVIATFTSNAGGGVVVDKANSSWRIPEEAWNAKGLTLDRGTYTISTSTKTADGKGEQSGNTESFTIYKPETSPSVAEAREQTVSKIFGMDDGSYWVFWVSNMGSSNAFDMFAQHYDQKGNAIGSRITVADKDTNAGHSNSDALHYISAYDVHFNTDESFVVYYQTNNGLVPNIAKFNKDGTKISDVPAPNVREWELDANYVQMDNGDYALIFASGTVHTYNVFMQRFKADGTAIDSVPIQQTFDNNRGSGFTQSLPNVSGNGSPSMEGLTGSFNTYACIGGISTTNLGNGLFAMTYMTSRESNLNTAKDADIFLRVYDFKSGQPVAAEIKLTSNDKFYQVDPAVVALKEGGFVVTWASNHESTNANNSGGQMNQFNMYSRRYALDANNKPVALDAEDKRVNTSTDGVNGVGYNRIQGHYDIAALEHGGYVIVWTKFTAGNRAEIYSQTFDAAGNKLGGETLVSTNSADKLDLRPDVTGLSDGGYAITWTSSTDKSTDWWTNVGGDIYSVIVNADGSIRGKGDDSIYPTNASYIDDAGALVGNDGVNTLDGKNGATSFNAGQGNDYIIIYDSEFTSVDGGEGNDTLIWNSFDNLDLSQISNKVESIEYLHLNDAYANTLTLDINDVLSMTPENDHLLVIQGGQTDTVDLDLSESEWSSLGAQTFRGETYNVYVHAIEDAQLWIQQGISVV